MIVKLKSTNSFKKHIQLTTLGLPAMLLLFIFSYVPMVGIIIAFKDINYRDGIFGSPWVGFDNFKFFFTSSDAWIVTRNTIAYNIVFIIVGLVTSLWFAILLSEVKNKMALKFYQTTFFFPGLFSWVVVSYMTYSFISVPNGIIVSLFKDVFNFDFAPLLSTLKFWPPFLVFVAVWKGLGFSSLIYYAGIMGISKEYYEAAEIDGASRFNKIRFITIPSLAPLITLLTIMSIGKIFYSDFGLFWFIPPEKNGALFPVIQVIDTYIYRMLRVNGDVGMSAAAGLYQSVVGFILIILSNYFISKYKEENRVF